MIIGGGNSVIEHIEGIKEYIRINKNIVLIFATARYAQAFADVKVEKYYCLVGNEGRRLTSNIGSDNFEGTCILPPYPRAMGTEVPSYAEEKTFELSSVDFTNEYKDSVTTVALQTSLQLATEEVYLVGYDGYPGNILSEKEMDLTHENISIFEAYKNATGKQLKSLTPTLYKELIIESVYQFI